MVAGLCSEGCWCCDSGSGSGSGSLLWLRIRYVIRAVLWLRGEEPRNQSKAPDNLADRGVLDDTGSSPRLLRRETSMSRRTDGKAGLSSNSETKCALLELWKALRQGNGESPGREQQGQAIPIRGQTALVVVGASDREGSRRAGGRSRPRRSARAGCRSWLPSRTPCFRVRSTTCSYGGDI